jgi:hypothetical protein
MLKDKIKRKQKMQRFINKIISKKNPAQYCRVYYALILMKTIALLK